MTYLFPSYGHKTLPLSSKCCRRDKCLKCLCHSCSSHPFSQWDKFPSAYSEARTNERTNERAREPNERRNIWIRDYRAHAHTRLPSNTHICRSPHNVDNHNANIKVKVFLCTAKINTQKLNTAERAHALQILTIYCLPISLRRYSFREQGVRKCLKLLLLCWLYSGNLFKAQRFQSKRKFRRKENKRTKANTQ